MNTNELIVSVSPHIHTKRTARGIMLDVIIALMPALAVSCVHFGLRSLLLTAVSAAGCVATEYVCNRLMKREQTIGDLSAVVTGILLAFNVPVSMPIWELLVGDVAAIAVAKMLFGGIGYNFVNPALVGRIVLFFSFAGDMTSYHPEVAATELLSGATPLAVMDKLTSADFMTLLLGQHGGVLGETCALALLAGGVYLVARRVIKPIVPLCYLGSTMLFTWLFGGPNPVLSVFAGGLMLGSIYMATDYTTTPRTDWGRVVFGVGCGLLTAAIRLFASYPEGVSFSILLMNLLVPYIDDLTAAAPLGRRKTK